MYLVNLNPQTYNVGVGRDPNKVFLEFFQDDLSSVPVVFRSRPFIHILTQVWWK